MSSMYFRVNESLDNIPEDFHSYGNYDEWSDFYIAVKKLHVRWKSMVGECVGSRHVFRLLRFRDKYGNAVDQWLPNFLLTVAPEPPLMENVMSMYDDEREQALNGVFGRGW